MSSPAAPSNSPTTTLHVPLLISAAASLLNTNPDAPAGPAEYTSPFFPSNTTEAFGSFASWLAKISASDGVEPCVAATVVGEDVVGGTVVAATMRELPGPLGAGNVESTTVVAPGTVVSVPVLTVPACNTGRNNN
jgi:hypothetical protein